MDDTYAAFRAELSDRDAVFALEIRPDASGLPLLSDSNGFSWLCRDDTDALLRLFDRLVHHVIAELARDGVYGIHAASLAHSGGAVILSGKSGAGKTTLTLGLVSRGLGILSDEFALSAPDESTILPYRRGLHVRPGTPELIPELRFLEDRPRHELGGGSEWCVLPDELERIFPGCLADAAPLRQVVLLEPRTGDTASVLETIPGGIAAVELVRATAAAADDFTAVLERTSRLVAGVRCARLRPGSLESSLDVLLEWISSGTPDA